MVTASCIHSHHHYVEINALENKSCTPLCSTKVDNPMNLHFLIQHEYQAEWILDDLPGATKMVENGKEVLIPGFPLGRVDYETSKLYFNTHASFIIRYTSNQNLIQIVGFEVAASNQCGSVKEATVDASLGELKFTYSVEWVEDNSKVRCTIDLVDWLDVVCSLELVYLQHRPADSLVFDCQFAGHHFAVVFGGGNHFTTSTQPRHRSL